MNERNLQIGKFTYYKIETKVMCYFIKSDLYVYI
jgi:hypothetical protein